MGLVRIAIGFGLMAAGMLLEGGHLRNLVGRDAAILVVGLVVGFRFAGLTVRRALLTATLAGPAVALLETLANLRNPTEIGQAVALGLLAMLYGWSGFLICTGRSARSEHPGGFARRAGGALVAAVGVAGAWVLLDPAMATAIMAPASFLVVLGGIVAAAAGDAPKPMGWSPEKVGAGALAGGMIGVTMGLVHVFANLDHPDAVLLGLARALFPMLLGFGVAAATRRPRGVLGYAVGAAALCGCMTALVMLAVTKAGV